MKALNRAVYVAHRVVWQITNPVTLGVRLILVQNNSVVLVKHSYQQHWYLPGGRVERAESLEQAARREAEEELGAQLGELRLFGLYSNFFEGKSDHVVVFSCCDFRLDNVANLEIEACSSFSLNELPSDTSPGSRRRIQEYLAGRTAPAVSLW